MAFNFKLPPHTHVDKSEKGVGTVIDKQVVTLKYNFYTVRRSVINSLTIHDFRGYSKNYRCIVLLFAKNRNTAAATNYAHDDIKLVGIQKHFFVYCFILSITYVTVNCEKKYQMHRYRNNNSIYRTTNSPSLNNSNYCPLIVFNI